MSNEPYTAARVIELAQNLPHDSKLRSDLMAYADRLAERRLLHIIDLFSRLHIAEPDDHLPQLCICTFPVGDPIHVEPLL